MKTGIVTTQANDPNKMYLRLLYHTFFWEFNTIEEIKEFVKEMDENDPMWDYDCYTIHKGDHRWGTKDFGCFDFEFLPEVKEEIEDYRN